MKFFAITVFSLVSFVATVTAWAESDKSGKISSHAFEWEWTEGAFKGAAFNVAFTKEGEVKWRGIKGPVVDKSGVEPQYSAKNISENVTLVTWTESSGYTVTIALNFDSKACSGVVSRDKEWYPLSGKFSRVN